MKKFIQLMVVAIVGTTGNIYAQSGVYAGDALRFSRTDYGSSARFKGLGNAQISLGGDISSIGGNPAGLGMFTRSEFSVSPEFSNIQAKSKYLGQDSKSTKNQFNLDQAAAVWYNPVVKPKGSDLNKGVISIVYGIGYNRNNDFYANNSYSGKNNNSSIANSFAQQSNGITPGNLDYIQGAAYDGFLTDKQLNTTDQYVSAAGPVNSQSMSEFREGSTSEFNFAAGMNISNKLYLGASIGFVDVRYVSDKLYNENGTIIANSSDNTSANPDDHANPHVGETYNLAYATLQNTTGSGINARLGVIYKPVNAVRIGATFQAPTWMHVEDDYSEQLSTKFSGGTFVQSDVINSNFNYNLRTPYKGSLGASVIITKNALLSADVDYVNYASTKFSVSDGGRGVIDDNNAYIKQNYASAINYRVGGEYRIDQFSIRAGYGLSGSPYKNDDKNTFDVKSYSGGIGYRFSLWYVDLAYQRTETNNTFSPYELADFSEPIATAKIARNNIFMTVGVKF
jgi:hypothetical protein